MPPEVFRRRTGAATNLYAPRPFAEALREIAASALDEHHDPKDPDQDQRAEGTGASEQLDFAAQLQIGRQSILCGNWLHPALKQQRCARRGKQRRSCRGDRHKFHEWAFRRPTGAFVQPCSADANGP